MLIIARFKTASLIRSPIMSKQTTFEPSQSDSEPVFWLARVPAALKRKAEKARLKNGHDKKGAMRRMIELYIADTAPHRDANG